MSGDPVVVVDYGLGNVFSVVQALRRCGNEPVLTDDVERIVGASRLILPGVGAFGKAKDRLVERGLDKAVLRFIETGRPFLGICVGMQLLLEIGTEFGRHDGLGVFKGTVDRIDLDDADGRPVRVPLIGWYPIEAPPERSDRWAGSPLSSTEPGSSFYFVHSFAAQGLDTSDVLAEVRHGGQRVIAAVGRDNITGLQFHPERSGPGGLAVLAGFLNQ